MRTPDAERQRRSRAARKLRAAQAAGKLPPAGPAVPASPSVPPSSVTPQAPAATVTAAAPAPDLLDLDDLAPATSPAPAPARVADLPRATDASQVAAAGQGQEVRVVVAGHAKEGDGVVAAAAHKGDAGAEETSGECDAASVTDGAGEGEKRSVERSPVTARPRPANRPPGVLADPRIVAAPQPVFDRVCARLIAGDPWHVVRVQEGVTWSTVNKRGLEAENLPFWLDVQAGMRRSMALDTASKAHAAGFEGVKRKVRTKVLADGTEEREEVEEHYADASMARLALEAIDTETFGRAAGRQTQAVVVPVAVNISFGGDLRSGLVDARVSRPAPVIIDAGEGDAGGEA